MLSTNSATVLELLRKSEEFLAKKEIPNPRLDSELLLSDLLGIPRIQLYVSFERKLTEEEKSEYRERIIRRSKNEPVAYIIGYKDFYDDRFKVNSSVLIPRPETEELIEWILEENDGSDEKCFLDLGTGSGCIAISIQKKRPHWKVMALDCSSESLEIAKDNAASILGENHKIEFLESDWFSNLNSTTDELRFDIVASNPPYIPIIEKPSLMPDVALFEPEIALFIQDPDSFYPPFLTDIALRLKQGGYLYMETHHAWVEIIQSLNLPSFQGAQNKKDLSGKQRFLKFTR